MTATRFTLFACTVLTLAPLIGGAEPVGRAPDCPASPEPAIRTKVDLRVIEELNGKDRLTLEGSYRKVVFKGINGEAKVDCAADFRADEISIESLNGTARVSLKLAKKARLKTLTLVRVNGETVLDAGGLDVAEIKVKELNGAATVTLQATGDVSVEQVNGSTHLTVSGCRDFTVKEDVKGSARVTAAYSGQAKVKSGSRGVTIKLNKLR